MGMEDDADEEYLSDDEFMQTLNDQEKNIFRALVISITETQMRKQK